MLLKNYYDAKITKSNIEHYKKIYPIDIDNNFVEYKGKKEKYIYK